MIARRASIVTVAGGVLAAALAIAAHGCSRNDSLVLIDLRASGPFGAPVASVRLKASGWPTRVVIGDIGPDGLRVGYYGPASGGAVTVTAEALDDAACVLGSGSGTVAKLASGATSDPVTVFVRPTRANGCLPDAGAMDGGGDEDAGGQDGGDDVAEDAPDDSAGDAPADAATDGGDDAPADAGSEAGLDSAADAMNGDAAADVTPEDGA